MPSPFVSTDWLAEHLDDPKIAIVDASWYLPNAGRDAHAEYLAAHIPGAVFFPIDEIADRTTDLPHMLPTPEAFAEMVGALGISETMTIVVYDNEGLFSSPRVWWTFKVMGAHDVRILKGGGLSWKIENRSLESGLPAIQKARFRPTYDSTRVTDFGHVRSLLGTSETQILDARPAARFRGESPEPRPGLRSGHIPGSRSVPASELTENGVLKSPEALKALFEKEKIDLDKPIVTTCGSGVTAAALALALETAGARNVAVYDGSWAEWGARPDAPIA